MQSRHKYLSYFWNSTLEKTRIKENKLYQKAKDETSGLNVFGHILFSLVIVMVAAFGLRSFESTLIPETQNKNIPIFAKVALAAEVTYEAESIFQSHKQINIQPEQAFTFNLSFKNTGTAIWTKEKVYLKSLTTALKFRHSFWPDPYLPAQLQEKIVNPGETGTFKFALQAPKNLNLYSGDFVLVSDNTMIKGGDVSVGMNVVEHPEEFASEKQTVQIPSAQIVTTTATAVVSAPVPKLNICTLRLNIAALTSGIDNLTCVSAFSLPEKGPDVRVGLFHTDKSVLIKNNQAWQVYDKNDTLLASVPADVEILFNYSEAKKEYTFDFINTTVRTSLSLYLKNFNDGIFTILSLTDLADWNKSINYNQFRGNLSLIFYQPTERVWVVNTLPLADYLKGMKETSNPDPAEYQKAMTIAARTYALYHVNKFKVEDSPFDLYPDERDQVYKGYIAETIMPNQANIVAETAGTVLTHSDEVIIAFYSARSGGQTLTSSKYPYLKSVETPYTKDLAKWGHGVGIDQQDAKARAEKLGWTYDQILKYYYSGINIEKIY